MLPNHELRKWRKEVDVSINKFRKLFWVPVPIGVGKYGIHQFLK
jgi:hypothetical protein